MSVSSIGNPDSSPPSIKDQPVKGSLEARKISYPIQTKDIKDTAAVANDKAGKVIMEQGKPAGEEVERPHDFTLAKEGIKGCSAEQLNARTELAISKINPDSTQKGFKGIEGQNTAGQVKTQSYIQKKPEEESYKIDLSKEEEERVPESSAELPPVPTTSDEETKPQKAGPEGIEGQEGLSEEQLEAAKEAAIFDEPEVPEQESTPTGAEPVETKEEVPESEEMKKKDVREKSEEPEQKTAPMGNPAIESKEVIPGLEGIDNDEIREMRDDKESLFTTEIAQQMVLMSPEANDIKAHPETKAGKTLLDIEQKLKGSFKAQMGNDPIFASPDGQVIVCSDERYRNKDLIERARLYHLPPNEVTIIIDAVRQGKVRFISRKKYNEIEANARREATKFLNDLRLQMEEELKQKKLRNRPESKKEGITQKGSTYQPGKVFNKSKEKVIPKERKELGKQTEEEIKAIEKKAAKKRYQRERAEELTEKSREIREEAWEADDLTRGINEEEEKREEEKKDESTNSP